MRLKVQLKFPNKEAEVVRQFCHEIGMSVEEFCKRAVYYSINDSYKRAEAAAHGRNNPTDRVTAGDTGSGLQPQSDADSSSLPNPQTLPDTNTAGS